MRCKLFFFEKPWALGRFYIFVHGSFWFLFLEVFFVHHFRKEKLICLLV